MKSERITFLATPEFKAKLRRTAAQEQLSIGALIRARFEPLANGGNGAEEQELRQLADQVHQALGQARQSLRDGLAQAEDVLHELRRHDDELASQRQVA